MTAPARPSAAFALAAVLGAGAAMGTGNAADPDAFWPINVELTRATGMAGAQAAIASGNDAMVLNPAGLAQARRYHLQLDGAYDSRFPGQGVTVSIADSASTAAGTGMLFQRWGAGQPDGRGEGWLGGLSYAYNAGSFLFGGTTKYLHFNGSYGEIQQFAQDLGLLVRHGDLSWAVVAQNLSPSTVPLFPPTSTLALAWGSDATWHLAVDYKTNLSDFNNLKHQVSFGGELLLDRTLVVRGGYRWDPSNHLGSISAGISLVTDKLGLHLAWRRRIQGSLEQFFEGGLTLYLE